MGGGGGRSTFPPNPKSIEAMAVMMMMMIMFIDVQGCISTSNVKKAII